MVINISKLCVRLKCVYFDWYNPIELVRLILTKSSHKSSSYVYEMFPTLEFECYKWTWYKFLSHLTVWHIINWIIVMLSSQIDGWFFDQIKLDFFFLIRHRFNFILFCSHNLERWSFSFHRWLNSEILSILIILSFDSATWFSQFRLEK